jgi:hypothetical protein
MLLRYEACHLALPDKVNFRSHVYYSCCENASQNKLVFTEIWCLWGGAWMYVCLQAYEKGTEEDEKFVQNLAMFLTTFLKEHLVLIETQPDLQQHLITALSYLINISYVQDAGVLPPQLLQHGLSHQIECMCLTSQRCCNRVSVSWPWGFSYMHARFAADFELYCLTHEPLQFWGRLCAFHRTIFANIWP